MSEIKPEILSDNSEVTINSQQVETLKKHFPQCFDKDGNFIAEKLNEIVANSGTALSKESYGLNWLGKSYARLLANENPLTLLAEDKEHNKKAENKDSQNLLIKGDNLEVLKHLKGAYSESIKMIYIDPPYNTGSDGFVYQDDRKFTSEQLAELAGIEAEEAKRILEFTQSKANSHSAWLTFMYPRLYIAREFLNDEGVIFISIDDNELTQLKLLLNEVFGESNFIGKYIHKNNSSKNQSKHVSVSTEYFFCYAKSKEKLLENTWRLPKKGVKEVSNLFEKLKKKGVSLEEIELQIKELYQRPKYSHLSRWNKVDESGVFKDADLSREGGPKSYTITNPHTGKSCIIPDRGWGKSHEELLRLQEEGLIWYGAPDTPPGLKDYITGDKLSVPDNFWFFDNSSDTKWIKKAFGSLVFENPKPNLMLQDIIKMTTTSSDIILDFFAGSGTTAHAVMELNKTDNGNRKFICVQLPEETEKTKVAYKAGYKTIFEITKARIEKAAEKIRAENPDYNGDLGFQIFETLPIFEGYLDNIETLQGDIQDLFDGATLSDEQLEHLLTTWKVYDGIPLAQPLVETDLAGYTAFRHEKVLYLMHQGFKTESLKEFLSKLDTTTGSDKDFDVEKIVMFGYNFDSKNQLEINEAVRQYQNRKEKNVSVVVRY